ncbi:Zinc finger protein [Penaeus vannamei]|uniref:Zinc finger protein n=1 Tax=Penaeus vannamei TaxID=6689 RepID=A0A3R7NRK1_PENVA|nr:Zinc finger protein [Penaeus vannamei]
MEAGERETTTQPSASRTGASRTRTHARGVERVRVEDGPVLFSLLSLFSFFNLSILDLSTLNSLSLVLSSFTLLLSLSQSLSLSTKAPASPLEASAGERRPPADQEDEEDILVSLFAFSLSSSSFLPSPSPSLVPTLPPHLPSSPTHLLLPSPSPSSPSSPSFLPPQFPPSSQPILLHFPTSYSSPFLPLPSPTSSSSPPSVNRPDTSTNLNASLSVSKPTIVCYICGREFGSSSIKIHEPQCLKKWRIQNENLPDDLKRPEPKKPEVVYDEEGKVDKEAMAEAAWKTHLETLVACKCGRTFFPDRLIVHQKACLKEAFRSYLSTTSRVSELPVSKFPGFEAPCLEVPGPGVSELPVSNFPSPFLSNFPGPSSRASRVSSSLELFLSKLVRLALSCPSGDSDSGLAPWTWMCRRTTRLKRSAFPVTSPPPPSLPLPHTSTRIHQLRRTSQPSEIQTPTLLIRDNHY